MSASVTDILTRLKMDSSEFNAKIAQAKKEVAEFSETSKSSFSAFGFGAGTLAVGAIAGLGYEIAKTTDKLNDLYETSKRLNIPISNLQELQYAFKDFGVTSDQVARSIQFMQRSIGEAQLDPKGAFGLAFKQINLDAAELAKLNPQDQFLKIASAIRQLNDVTKEQAELRKILGRGGSSLAGAVESGELEKAIEKYKGLGIDKDTAENAHKFILQLNYAEAVMESLSFKFIGKLTSWFDQLQSHIRSTLDFINSNFNNFTSTNPNNTSKLKQLDDTNAKLGWEWERNDQYNWPGAGPGKLQKRGTADLDAALGNSHIPNYLDSSSIEKLNSSPTQKVQSQLEKLGKSAENAAIKIKDMSETSQLLASGQKSAITEELKDILGDELKPSSPSVNDTNNPYADLLKQDMQNWKDDVKDLFNDIKQYGDNPSNERRLQALKSQANSIGDTTGVGVINDLSKFAKEQKTPKSEIKIFLDPQLKGTIIKQEGNKITFEQAIQDAASSMGK